MPLTSDDVNALIMQYLTEAGYQHSAFIFGKESLAGSAASGERRFEPGTLVALIQKGLQYQELLAQDTASGDSTESTYRRYPVAQLLVTPDPTKLAAPESTAPIEHAGKALHGHTGDVLAVAWSAQTAVLATAAADSTARLWHLQGAGSAPSSASVPCDILQHHQVEAAGAPATVHALAWAPDGSWVATAAFDGLVRVWGEHGHLHRVLRLEGASGEAPDQITALAASPCGARLAATSMNASVGVWDAASGALLRGRHGGGGGALALAWLSPTTLATCGDDGAVNVLELSRAPASEGAAEASVEVWDLQHTLRLQGHTGHVNCAAASPDGTRLCTGSDDGTARLWQVERDFGHEERQLHCFSAPGNGGGAVLQCAFRKAGDAVDKQEEALLVATCSRSGVAPSDANVRVWSCDTGELVQEWRAGARDAVGVAWSPCGAMVAAAAADSAVRVWHVKTGDAVLDAPMPEAVMAVAWGKSGSLAVGLCSGGVRVLEVAQS